MVRPNEHKDSKRKKQNKERQNSERQNKESEEYNWFYEFINYDDHRKYSYISSGIKNPKNYIEYQEDFLKKVSS